MTDPVTTIHEFMPLNLLMLQHPISVSDERPVNIASLIQPKFLFLIVVSTLDKKDKKLYVATYLCFVEFNW